MNSAIVVNETGWKAVGFSADFKKYAREKGIRDPFEVSQKLFAKRVKRNEDGSTTVRIK
jgi:microsomal dipeptidase-like Zn-dependent dipeptidase